MHAWIGNYIVANKWSYDSGATNHITPNRQYFDKYEKFAVFEIISLGKQNVSAQAYCSTTIKIEGQTSYIKIKNVL